MGRTSKARLPLGASHHVPGRHRQPSGEPKCELWNAHLADLRSRFPLTEAQESRSAPAWSMAGSPRRSRGKDRLIKDRAFYRRLLDGDREANRQWGLLTSLLALRPVKRPDNSRTIMAAPVLPRNHEIVGAFPFRRRVSGSSRPRIGRMICSCTSQKVAEEFEPRKGRPSVS